MLQKELAKRLRARYDTKMDGNGWLEVSSDGVPLCRIKYNGQFLSNADQMQNDCDECSNQDSENAKTSLLSCLHKKTASIAGCLPFFLLPRRADLIHVCPISALYKGGTLGI